MKAKKSIYRDGDGNSICVLCGWEGRHGRDILFHMSTRHTYSHLARFNLHQVVYPQRENFVEAKIPCYKNSRASFEVSKIKEHECGSNLCANTTYRLKLKLASYVEDKKKAALETEDSESIKNNMNNIA